MSSHGLIVIGGGPAGLSAAESFRRYNDELPVSIFTADPDRPYARPPLSKEYLRGETDDVDLHPSQWYAERSIDVVRCATVEDIDLAGRGLVVDGTTHRYKSLVIACGASPTPLPVPGGEHTLQLRSRADADRLRYGAVGASSVLIIGAGFIGCEAAASLAMRGLVVTVVAPDAAPQTQRLGSEAGEHLLGLLHGTGVRYVGGVEVEAISEDGVVLDNDTTMDADLVVLPPGYSRAAILPLTASSSTSRGSWSVPTWRHRWTACTPRATSRWPTTQPQDGIWLSSIGRMRSIRARPPALVRPAGTRHGMACRAFGQRSARRP